MNSKDLLSQSVCSSCGTFHCSYRRVISSNHINGEGHSGHSLDIASDNELSRESFFPTLCSGELGLIEWLDDQTGRC